MQDVFLTHDIYPHPNLRKSPGPTTFSYTLQKVRLDFKQVTGGYVGLQEVTWGYRGLQKVTGSYKKLEEVITGYRVLQGVTGSYRG